MRNYYWALVLMIIVVYNISSQESEYYAILNELLPDKTIKLVKNSNDFFKKNVDEVYKNLVYNEYRYYSNTKLSQSEWSQKIVADTNYIAKQLNLPKQKWKRKFIEKKNLKFKRNNKLISIFKSLFPFDNKVKNTIYSVSRPIFINKENKVAIVYLEIYKGPEYGIGSVILFLKTNKSWKENGNRMLWIS